MIFRLVFLTSVLIAAASPFQALASVAESVRATLVIDNVGVIPMTENGETLTGRTVVIEADRIVAILPADRNRDFAGAVRIDGSGKWLVPGFSDVHVHLGNDRMLRLLTGRETPADGTAILQDFFTPYIANGVLQVFDLASMAETIGQRVEIESGRILGPHIVTAAMIDGENPILPFGISRIAASPGDGRQAVRDAQAEGYRYVKIYGRVDLPTFTAIVDEARSRNIRVVGHIPQRGQGMTASFFQPGYDLVVHAEEFAQQTKVPDMAAIPAYVEMARGNGTALVATLSANKRILEIASDPTSLKARTDLLSLPPEFYSLHVDLNPYAAQSNESFVGYASSIVNFNDPFVRAFSEAGLTVLTGSDAGVPGIAPGYSLHDEFQALAQAGLDNRTILEGSTRLAAEWLGVDHDRGTVAIGMRADLVLLEDNPIIEIANTRKIAAVIRDGKYMDRALLDSMIAELTKRNRR